MITPPAGHLASGSVGYTLDAVNKLFWDACIFETGLLRYWKFQCPFCGKDEMVGGRIYVKIPEKNVPDWSYTFCDENGDPIIYLYFTCQNCSEIAYHKGYPLPKLKRTEIFPTVIPLIVSENPLKTARGIKNYFSYKIPSNGFCVVIGDVMSSCIVPKKLFIIDYNYFDEFLKNLIGSKQYPEIITPSLKGLQQDFKEKKLNPNDILIAYSMPSRKESYWLSPGMESEERLKKVTQDMVEEEF